MKIYPLFDLPEECLPQVGGKARGLYLLHKAGFPVADGIVLYGIENEEDAQSAAEAYEQSGLGCVAVRSSASGEDGTEFSGAGQYETVLNVTGKEAVREAVLTCLNSLKSARVQAYAQNLSQADTGSMNVVVQTMVDAAVAGVAFSVSPSNSEEILVEAVEGLGESLVSGAKRSQGFVYSRHTPEYAENKLLSAAMQKQIVEELCAAEDVLHAPADCEWAVDKDGKLYWLQARPITAVQEPDIDEFTCKRDFTGRVVTRCNIGEMLPGAVTPLTYSTSIYALDWGIRNMIYLAGVIKSPDALPAYSTIFNVKNHLFIDLSSIYLIGRNVMMASESSIDLAICGSALDFEKTKVKRCNVFKRFRNGIKYMKILTGTEKSKRKLVEIVDKFVFTASESARAVYDEIGSYLPLMNEAMWYHYNTSSHSGAMNGALNIVLKDAYSDPEEIKALIAGTLEGIDGIESVAILADLKAVARAIKEENPDAKDWSAEQIQAYLESGGESEGKKAVARFLKRHGHRAIREAELRSKAWRDDIPALCGYLKTVLSAPEEEEKQTDPHDWEKNMQTLAAPLKGMRKKAVPFLVQQCRKGVVNREFSKSYIIKVIDLFKQRYRLLAKMLVADGLLPDEDGIYFLTHEEIGKLLAGEKGLSKKIAARRRLLAEQNTLVFPETCMGLPEPIEFNEAGRSELKGVPVSRGKAKGRARVIKSIEDAARLQPGEIMVTRFTDIGWSPYYCLVGALITEVGSALSHGAVVAREYALPVVVNVHFATELIKTGDMLSVDGSTGRVTVLSEN